VLATGLGNTAAVWVLTGSSVRFGSRPGQNLTSICFGGLLPCLGIELGVFGRVANGLRFEIYGSNSFGTN